MTVPGNLSSPLLATAAAAAAEAEFSIQKSVRFNDDDSAHFTRTPSAAGNRRTFTWSGWFKRSTVDGTHVLFAAGSDANNRFALRFSSGQLFIVDQVGGSAIIRNRTEEEYRDPASWYHFVVAIDSTQSTSSDRLKLYVNGSVVEDYDITNYPSQNQQFNVNSTDEHYIGKRVAENQYFDGLMGNVHFIDGLGLAASDFGFYDDNNVWRPKEYTGTFGTNGFHLFDFANESTLGHDSSGNNNDWTANNFSTSAGVGNDVLFDSPTNGDSSDDSGAGGEVSGNYPTWNPLDNGGSLTLSNGNLNAENTGGAHNACRATFKYPSTGKWYYEAEITTLGGACCIGVDNSGREDPELAKSGTFFILVNSGGSVQKYNQSSVTNMSGMGTPAVGGILQVAYDADADKVWFGLNNNWMGSGSSANGNPGAGTEASISSISDPFPVTNQSTSACAVNFGQRAFSYSAPTNFKPLCTTLLPTPTIANGRDYFQAKTWDGNGGTQSITTTGMSPDLVWIKSRSNIEHHSLNDTVRGANKQLESSRNITETTHSNILTSFDSSGFTLSSSDAVNKSSATHVGWCWDAGSSTVSNTDGNITTSLRANAAAGFSIATYSGTGTNGDTIGHGLGVQPDFVIVKARNKSDDWRVYHSALGTGYIPALNSTTVSTGANWQSISNTTLGLQNDAAVNGSGYNYVAYFFAAVAGYSAVASYEGTGSAGNFVHTGFRVGWLLLKNADGTNSWQIMDTTREPLNQNNVWLQPNTATAEQDNSAIGIDFLSNGFCLRGTDGGVNGSGNTYIYYAVAENPFQANGGLAR